MGETGSRGGRSGRPVKNQVKVLHADDDDHEELDAGAGSRTKGGHPGTVAKQVLTAEFMGIDGVVQVLGSLKLSDASNRNSRSTGIVAQESDRSQDGSMEAAVTSSRCALILFHCLHWEKHFTPNFNPNWTSCFFKSVGHMSAFFISVELSQYDKIELVICKASTLGSLGVMKATEKQARICVPVRIKSYNVRLYWMEFYPLHMHFWLPEVLVLFQ